METLSEKPPLSSVETGRLLGLLRRKRDAAIAQLAIREQERESLLSEIAELSQMVSSLERGAHQA